MTCSLNVRVVGVLRYIRCRSLQIRHSYNLACACCFLLRFFFCVCVSEVSRVLKNWLFICVSIIVSSRRLDFHVKQAEFLFFFFFHSITPRAHGASRLRRLSGCRAASLIPTTGGISRRKDWTPQLPCPHLSIVATHADFFSPSILFRLPSRFLARELF